MRVNGNNFTNVRYTDATVFPAEAPRMNFNPALTQWQKKTASET